MRYVRIVGGALALTWMVVCAVARPSEAKSVQITSQQQPQPHQPGQVGSPLDPTLGTASGSAPDPYKAKMEAARAKAVSDDRHKRLEDDSVKLLQMATDLKAEVDKTPKDELSLIVVRKATEIEKLAHDIREREKN